MSNAEVNILVVENDRAVLTDAVTLLKNSGYNASGVDTGELALRYAENSLPDLILLGAVLPDINGFEVCRRIKRNKKTSDIFVAIFSGKRTEPDHKAEGLEIGADEYIVRPIENRELIARVNAMLRLKLAENELLKYQTQMERLVESRTAELMAEIKLRELTERKLKDSQQQYISVIDTITDGVAILNTHGVIIFANPAFSQMYRYTQDELTGMNALKLISPDYHHMFEKFQNDLKKNGNFRGETVDIRKDGSRFSTDVVGTKINFKGQSCFLALIRDVTDQRNYEEALKKSAEEWQSTFDATNNVIWILDRDYRILRSNRMAESVFNLSSDSMLGRHCWEIVHGTENPIKECPFCRVEKSLKRETAEIQTGDAWYEVTIDPILNGNGDFTRAVHIITDITERKNAEIALKESRMMYKALFQENSSVMLLTDPRSGDIIDANPSACSYYGYPKKTITKMKIFEINMLSTDEIKAEILKAESEERNYFNFRHRLAGGDIHDVEVFSGLIHVNGRPVLFSIIHDVSERKASERERERLINELQDALDEIKTLRGIVPICSHCKKVRDDKGYWNKLEAYVEKHSDASFSHGMCPECMEHLYGRENWYIKMKKDKKGG